MSDRNIIEKEKELILKNIGIYPKHKDLYKKLKIKKTTFYSRLKEIQDDCNLIPAEHMATVALEQFNQLRAKMNISWKYFTLAQEEYEKERMRKAPDEAILEKLENKLIRWQVQHSYATKDLTTFLKAIGHYAPDILLGGGGGPTVINLNMQNMGDAEPKKTEREVNPK